MLCGQLLNYIALVNSDEKKFGPVQNTHTPPPPNTLHEAKGMKLMETEGWLSCMRAGKEM